ASQKEVGTLRYLSLVVPPKKVGDEAVHKELGDRMERATTTASSLEAEQESGPIQQGGGSTVLVESHHIPITTPSTSQPPLSSPFRVPTPPHDSPLPGVASLEQDLKHTKKVYSNAYTKLIMSVKKLEHKVKSRQLRRRARVVISDSEEDLEDPSKQGRRIAKIDQNPFISLLQDEGTLWI
ncbi:hypothetical protein Tco_1249695, partial [Tanacetum coccineum]